MTTIIPVEDITATCPSWCTDHAIDDAEHGNDASHYHERLEQRFLGHGVAFGLNQSVFFDDGPADRGGPSRRAGDQRATARSPVGASAVDIAPGPVRSALRPTRCSQRS